MLFGSRLVESLETQLMRTRQDYEHRLMERDSTIDELRAERDRLRTKFDEYEADPSYYWWLSQRTQARLPRRPDFQQDTESAPEGSWQRIQQDWYRKQDEEARLAADKEKVEHGIPVEGRQEAQQQV